MVIEEALQQNSKAKHKSATRVTVIPGDGIGPEIMGSVLTILAAARAGIDAEFAEAGEQVYLAGQTSGIPAETWNSIRETGLVLKGPITTPQGGGYKSLNVTLRKTLGLYANVRPCRAYVPYVPAMNPDIDVVIVRENEEDLYAGIEHRQTADVTQCLKLITRKGCERIVRYAFEYAAQRGRKKVTCMTKDNIMKLTDGLFHRVFDEIRAEYPNVDSNHQIIDFGMANFVARPTQYDVIVLPNLYGDILSDVAAEMTGSVGMGGSANLGPKSAVFEAIHGSAPGLARDIANPSGLLMAALEMISYIGKVDVTRTIHNAWLKTLEDGIHTADIFSEMTTQRVGTMQFTKSVIERLGDAPVTFGRVQFAGCIRAELEHPVEEKAPPDVKKLVGMDVFLDWTDAGPNELAERLQVLKTPGFALKMITNRGVKVWPNGHEDTVCTDHWRCRFQMTDNSGAATGVDLVKILAAVADAGFECIKTENLYTFNDVPGFALAQGQ